MNKKVLILIYLLFLFKMNFGQSNKDILTKGSWKKIGIKYKKQFYPSTDTTYLTFNKDSVFSIKYFQNGFSYNQGHWQSSNRVSYIVLKNKNHLKANINYETLSVKSINDTLLVIIKCGGGKPSYEHYKYVPKQQIKDSAQITKIVKEISNLIKPKRFQFQKGEESLKISKNNYISVVLKPNFSNPIPNEIKIYTGYLLDNSDSNITLVYSNLKLSTTFVSLKDNWHYKTENRYFHNYKYINLKLSEINKIEFTNPYHKRMYSLKNGLTISSLATVLLIAPLASANIKKQTFNSKRYYTIAAIGLAGLTVGVSLRWHNEKEEINFIPEENGEKWKIEQVKNN